MKVAESRADTVEQILTTALFSVTMLRRTIGMKRWISLIVLTIGVSVVSLPQSGRRSDDAMLLHDTTDHFFPRSVHELGQMANGVREVAHELTKRAAGGLADQLLTRRSASYEGIKEDEDTQFVMNYSVGLAAVLVAAVVSGLTGVYFEKVLKDSPSPVSVWTRNIQLSFYSLFPALFVGVIFKDGAEIAKHGFFDGYNWVVWTAIVFQAVGGVLASLCINYADNIAKNFATSISIVISFVFSVYFFDFKVSTSVRIPIPGLEEAAPHGGLRLTRYFPQFLTGTTLVLASTYLYSVPDRKRGRPPPISIMSYEKGVPDTDYTPQTADLLDPLESVRALSTSRPASPMPRPVSVSTRKNRGD